MPSGSKFVITLPATPTDYSITSATPACTSVFTTATLTCTFSGGVLTVSGMFPVGNNNG